MTQFQFDMICKVIENGAPAVADELCGALNDLVVNYNHAVNELRSIKEAAQEAEKNEQVIEEKAE